MNGHVHRRVYERDAAGNPTKFGWQARYKDPRHPRKRHEKTFTRKADAERWLQAQSAALLTGTHVDPAKQARRFEELVAAWQETRFASLAPSSRARYEQVVRTHLTPEFGGSRVTDIDREAVRRYFGKLAQRVADDEISGGTVRKIHTTMSAIMSEAVEVGLVPANPCTRVRGMPSARSKRKPIFLTVAEVQRLAAAFDLPHHSLLILTAAFTGLRSGELLALRRRHVNLLHARIRVEDAIKGWHDGQPIIGSTKSGKGRVVGLEPTLHALLRDHLAALPGGDDAFVFVNSEGGPIHHESWMRNYYYPTLEVALPHYAADKTAKKLGLRFHDLRHTCASMLIGHGANGLEIKEWLGHASIGTTYDVYGHLMEDNVDDLATRLGNAVTGSENVVALATTPG